MRVRLSWVLLMACAFVDAAPSVRSVHKVKETISPPSKWTRGDRAPSNAIIELRIALPQSNFAELERHLNEVSDPFHERYGQHLSKEEVDALITPHPDSVSLVDEWLALYGLRESNLARTASGDWIKVKIPISLAEEMLDTTYHVYTHSSGTTALRTTSYSLPEHLHDHIELVQPTTLFSTFKRQATTFHFDKEEKFTQAVNAPPINVPTASGGKVDASCNTTITISCLKQLYNAVGYVPSAKNGNKVAVTGYLEQFANLQDLQLFYADQRPDALNSSFTFVSVNGGLNNQTVADAGAEADLDTQFAFGLTHPIPATFFSTAGRPPFIPDIGETQNTNEPYLDWLDFILNERNPPQTISTSYADDEQTVPKSFAQRACNGFATLGARGVSLTFSSGDGGVGDGDPDPATQQCFTNDGTNRTEFIPGFPPSCPFVTAVGGTIHIPETAVFFSGGGFSNVFPRPEFQNPAVPNFLKKLPKGTFAGLFNPNGRAFPDVSAQADNFKIFFQGTPGLIGGTSASAPTFAGFVALLNDARIKAGLPTLGFLNPLIYAIGATHPTAFNDITTGNNPGCGTEGFNATVGWDAVTGWGTPNFGRLKDLVTGKFR
ncbi:tripeptidyl peptidase A [Irpex rosettiformis]|uniref:Tripeptidyl peptidase A n=1 Tax=Irpex rosettiformis TaxID=378272 RepID=A0ACB8U9R0_9APHY|nr:tripeptidyl peptidase A [Irpex rosettiformis]